MNDLVPTKCIDFPPVAAQEKLKLQRFLKSTGEFMEVDFEIEEVTIIRVSVAAARADVVTILNKVAANEKKKQREGDKKEGENDE
jgi:hypothetical protein